uniref:Uncharacterized protein n=1 Tax=Nelumbo nucifera TaxID=4432 RepID=A0A822YNW5_NELNU|nr:TPA_asm: hypothetical protein HUJ06_011397 [Nelumbo nucifera]
MKTRLGLGWGRRDMVEMRVASTMSKVLKAFDKCFKLQRCDTNHSTTWMHDMLFITKEA